MKAELVHIMNRIPPEPLRVYLYLLERASREIRIGLTQQEISRATRLSVGAVRESLGWLEQPFWHDAGLVDDSVKDSSFVSLRKISNYYEIVLLVPYSEGEKIKFTFDDTDSRRIEVLEKEVRRLSSKSAQEGKVSIFLRGERQNLIAEIEGDLGRGLSKQETWLLSGIVHEFGPERVKKAWRQKAHELDKPIIALYAMFINKALGKGSQKLGEKAPEDQEVRYRKVDRTQEFV